jgi:hypothetical protein
MTAKECRSARRLLGSNRRSSVWRSRALALDEYERTMAVVAENLASRQTA